MLSQKQISVLVKILLLGIIVYISRTYPPLFKAVVVPQMLKVKQQ